MSGFDRGAHIISLTNMIAPDIFVPGNHEFDFGKAVFFQRTGEAQLRGPDRAPLGANKCGGANPLAVSARHATGTAKQTSGRSEQRHIKGRRTLGGRPLFFSPLGVGLRWSGGPPMMPGADGDHIMPVDHWGV
jgi:hypothetical protein